MRENGVDSPYLFLHPGFSIVTSLAHPEEMLKRYMSIPVDICIRFRTIPVIESATVLSDYIYINGHQPQSHNPLLVHVHAG